MQNIRYRGKSDIRRITDTQWLSVGIVAPTVEWTKANGYEVIIDDLAAAYCLAQGDFEAGDPNLKFGKIFNRAFVNVPSGWGDCRWDAAKYLAATQPVNIDLWGDSIGAQGQGVTPANVDNYKTISMAGLTAAATRAKWGDGGSGYWSYEMATQTGTWTAAIGAFGNWVTATAAASLTWTNVNGTTIELFHRNTGVTGSFRYRIDGGSWTTVTPPTLFGLESGGTTDAVSAGNHTVEVEWVSGTVTIAGVRGKRATGIIFNRYGGSGRQASNYALDVRMRDRTAATTNASPTVTCSAPGWFTKDMEQKWLRGTNIPAGAKINTVTDAVTLTLDRNCTATGSTQVDLCGNDTYFSTTPGMTVEPFLAAGTTRADLVIICLGANDPISGGADLDVYRDGLNRIVSQYTGHTTNNNREYSPDWIFIIEHQGNWPTLDTWAKKPNIATVLAEYALGLNGALIDVWGMGKRSHKYWSTAPNLYLGDVIHPNNAGHIKYSEPLIELLTME